ncbi:MAG: peptide-methionine (S)-S-oxide reductase MsrA [Bacillota bacterium]|nr:peptide-methionine (S)-S-oxide reductase MsrA [Bacillota bacterium]HHU62310.1 peptide-methionine (S)-S-oxide reductase MsrA [Natronincola sp.]
MKRSSAIFGGGCFWCLEAIFSDLEGVFRITPGYSGGHVPNPTYQQVCNTETGHAEVVQIDYDEDVITYKELLEIFFSTHDPTTLNRQGADEGTQYRSVIFYQNQGEKETAEEVKRAMSELWEDPIVTEITPLDVLYPAEQYHKNYFRLNPEQGYCKMVIAPKVAKFRAQFKDKLRTS